MPSVSRVAATISVLPEISRQLADQIPEVWIYDNGSTPPMKLPQVKYRSDINLKFVGGWNDAMDRIIADVHPEAVWMMNDDITGASSWLFDRLYTAMELTNDAAVITPVFNSPHEVFHATRQAYGLRKVPWIDWCCPIVSVRAWEEVGPFDEAFVGYGADIDWCKRARDLGWSFYVHEGCHIHHIGSQTTFALGATDMSDVGHMAKTLQEKWGVPSWWDLTR